MRKGVGIMRPETITIDNQKYVRADSVQEPAQEVDGMKYCIIRSYGAGVFAGYVKEQKSEVNGVNVTLVNSRRIHYWDGACSLSQVAMDGSKNISECRIAMEIPEQFIANVIEIIPASSTAKSIIEGAELWKK